MNRSITPQTDHLKKAPPDPGPTIDPADHSPCDAEMNQKMILTFTRKNLLQLLKDTACVNLPPLNLNLFGPKQSIYFPDQPSLLKLLSLLLVTGNRREQYSEDIGLVSIAASGATERSPQRKLPQSSPTQLNDSITNALESWVICYRKSCCSFADWTFQYYLWSYFIGGTLRDYYAKFLSEKTTGKEPDKNKTVLQEPEVEKLCREEFPVKQTILVTVKVRVYFTLQVSSPEPEMGDRQELFDPLECYMDLADIQARVQEADRNGREDQEPMDDVEMDFQDHEEEEDNLEAFLNLQNDDGEDDFVADYLNRASPVPPPQAQPPNVHQLGNIQANPPWQKPSQTQNDHVVPNSVNARNPNS